MNKHTLLLTFLGLGCPPPFRAVVLNTAAAVVFPSRWACASPQGFAAPCVAEKSTTGAKVKCASQSSTLIASEDQVMYFVWQRVIWLRYSQECSILTHYTCYLLPWSGDPGGRGARGIADWHVGVAVGKGGVVGGAGPLSIGTVGVVGWRRGRRRPMATTASTKLGSACQEVR